MIRFITNLLMISTFFVGLGAIGDTLRKALIPNELECEMQRIRVVKIENDSAENIQLQIIMQNFENPIAERNFLILRESEIVE